jgi:hypothetical protein
MARLGPWNPELYEGNPWHARQFMRGETDDLPFDRDSIVLYSSYTEAIFWEESETPENVANSRSVLETKLLSPTNTEYGDASIATDKITEDSKAIWLGMFPTAKLHALWKQEREGGKNIKDGAVLELHLPTEPLTCLIDAKPGSTSGTFNSEKDSGVNISSSEEFIEKLGSGSRENAVKELRERLRKVASVESNFKGGGNFVTAELVQFATAYNAHLDNVKRVWTPKFSKGHTWLPIEKYLENIESQDSGSPTFDLEREVEKEYKEHEKLRKASEDLRFAVRQNHPGQTSAGRPKWIFFWPEHVMFNREDVENLSKQDLERLVEEKAKSIDSETGQFEKKKYIENTIKPYVYAQKDIKEVFREMSKFTSLKKLTGIKDFSFGRKIRTCHEAIEYKEEIDRYTKAFHNSVVKLDETEKKKLKEEDWGNREKIREIETKGNEALLEMASKIPDLRPLKDNIERETEEWLRIEAMNMRGELEQESSGLISSLF